MIIKWEIGDLNGTSASIDSRRQPVHPTAAADQHIGVVSHVKLAINAAEIKEQKQTPDLIQKTPTKNSVMMQENAGFHSSLSLPYLFSRTMSGSQTVLYGTRITSMP